MINEEFYSELLLKYFVGKLSKEEEQDLLAWLKEDEEHRLLMERMSDWWAIAHVPLFKSDLEADFDEHFHHLIKTLPVNEEVQKKQLTLKTWMRFAAVILLLLTVGVSAFFIGKKSDNGRILTYIETVVPRGSRSTVVLPDSSVVILNSSSTLKYPKDFDANERRVELTGEAYFDIKSNPEKPFIVSSDKLEVRVKGTTFNMKAYGDEERIDVVLISGNVDIQFPNDEKDEIALSPNQQLSFNKKEEKAIVSAVNASNSILWTQGILQFSEKIFPEIAKELERKYNVDIEVQSTSLDKEIFSGSFTSDYTLEQIIHEIDMDNKYKWSYKNNKLIITDK